MRRISWKSALALACTTAGLAIVASAAPAADKPISDRQEVRVPVAGVQVAIDPETGRLRQPTPEEAREMMRGLAELMQPATKSLEATTHADGSLSVVLGSDMLSIALARLDGDSVAQACFDNVDQAAQFLQGAPALEDK